jgi:hypothetical protein
LRSAATSLAKLDVDRFPGGLPRFLVVPAASVCTVFLTLFAMNLSFLHNPSAFNRLGEPQQCLSSVYLVNPQQIYPKHE